MIYQVESVSKGPNCSIYEFHRNSDGTKNIKEIRKYKPYFFVDDACPLEMWDGILSVQKGFTSIEGTPVKKVIYNHPIKTQSLRTKIERIHYKTWEADVPFHDRYTIDACEMNKDAQLKVCFLDIETSATDGLFPDIKTANQEITCMTAKIGDKSKTWLYHETKTVEGAKCFTNETEMLNDFMNYFMQESPDIVTAWNLINFDLIYIINRCDRLGVDYKRLSPLRSVDVRESKKNNQFYITIKGLVALDLLTAYKLWRKYGGLPNLSSYALDNVANEVLNHGKLEHMPFNILWKEHPDKLIEYNKVDVELLDELDKKCKVIDFFDELRRKCHIQFDEVYRTTALIDGYLLKRLNKEFILPTAKKNTGDKFEGAFVVDPTPGVYDNISVLDIKSMYPNIIKTYNISYETVGGVIKLPVKGLSFKQDKVGLIPRYLGELADERNHYKGLLKESINNDDKDGIQLWNQRQISTKILMNSFYGYLGFKGSRLYKTEVAEAVTGMGVYLIKMIGDWVRDAGNKVVYGDTDSVYLLSKHSEAVKAVNEGFELTEMINKKLEEYNNSIGCKNYIEIEFEKMLRRMLFTDAKKRYAFYNSWTDKKGFAPDNKLHIQGFDAKRSDSNKPSKDAQIGALKMILDNKSEEETKSFIKGLIKDMKDRKYTDEEIGFPKGISKPLEEYGVPGPIIKGAAYSNKHFNTTFGKGSKPKFVWIESIANMPDTITMNLYKSGIGWHDKEYIIESIAYDEKIPDKVVVDWNRMIEVTFKKKLENIFNAVGWEWDLSEFDKTEGDRRKRELTKRNKEQTNLGAFQK